MSTTNDTVISFRVPLDMKIKIQQIAKEQKRTVGSILREIIERFVIECEMKNNINK